MTEELAKLNLRFGGEVYRIKVFENMVGIECQPDGENVLLSKAEQPDVAQLYDPQTDVWNYGALFWLLRWYPFYTSN